MRTIWTFFVGFVVVAITSSVFLGIFVALSYLSPTSYLTKLIAGVLIIALVIHAAHICYEVGKEFTGRKSDDSNSKTCNSEGGDLFVNGIKPLEIITKLGAE